MDDGDDSDFGLPRAKRNKTTTKVLRVHKLLWFYLNILSPQKPLLPVVISSESSSDDNQDADKVLFTCCS